MGGTKWTLLLLATILTNGQCDNNDTTTTLTNLVNDEESVTPAINPNKESFRINNNNNNQVNNGKINDTIEISESLSSNNSDDGGNNQISERREISDAIEYGLSAMNDLIENQEPKLYKMGLVLNHNSPGRFLANFGAPASEKALKLARIGYATVEASKKIAQTNPSSFARQAAETRLLAAECPLQGVPRCPAAARRFRTADGTCNNLRHPWRGSALLPMRRFLPPAYDDGVQEPRRGLSGRPLPSARAISTAVHRDRDVEMATVTLMAMQWGQFVDHDLVATVKGRGFNGTVPACCDEGGLDFLPPHLTHPSCLPIAIPSNDPTFSHFGHRCMEFLRSAPSTRIDCDLGHREQLNQVTSYLDASPIYGSDTSTAASTRTFRRGKLTYGRAAPSRPADPPGGELCRAGALSADCVRSGDGRLGEQVGLTALHTVWVRLHNKLAEGLGGANAHWSDERVYQEARRVVGALVQQVTYREWLPVVLGAEVVELFGLGVGERGWYGGYEEGADATVGNAFGAGAFRFGHSLVQGSYVRFDREHRPIFNNVSLHEEHSNPENIWSFGSLDRLLLGFSNQPSQKRDQYITTELTNHLFQFAPSPFGMDLAAINIQRGRDHGLPAYAAWRRPCGLAPLAAWSDLPAVMPAGAVASLRQLYERVADIDLFTGGLAERPVRGALVGPTFACIIAQQFRDLRNGDRFWYENGAFESSFTPAQLEQVRRVTLANVLCQTLTEIDGLQPFVFLAADTDGNRRGKCASGPIFDLRPWIENAGRREERRKKKKKKNKVRVGTTTKKPRDRLTIKIANITTSSVKLQNQYLTPNVYGVNTIPNRPTFDNYAPYRRKTTTDKNDVTYMFGFYDFTTTTTTTTPPPPPKPIEVNIKIQYYPTTSTTTKRPKTKKPNTPTIVQSDNYYPLYYQPTTTQKSYYPYVSANGYSDDFSIYRPYIKYEERPVTSSTKRPYYYRPNEYIYKPTNFDRVQTVDDKLGFNNDKKKQKPTKYVKISSVTGGEYMTNGNNPTNIHLHISQREGELDLFDSAESEVRMVDLEVMPDENRWVVYNATETEVAVRLPIVKESETCTDELPRPIL